MGVRTVEYRFSDLSGDELPEGKGRTVNFSVEGTNYRLDLTDAEGKAFDKALATYISKAATVAAPRATAPRSTGRRAPSGSGRSKEELAEIRAWLVEQGHAVAPRGRVRAELLALYDEAHSK